MSESKSVKTKINVFRAVGMLAVILLAAYFVYGFVQYQKKNRYSFYEVEEGSLVREHSYQGIILRNETVKTSIASGYINFYIPDTKKAAMNSRVYSIDESGDLKNFLASHAEKLNSLSESKIQSIRKTVMNASRSFDPMDFKSSRMLLDTLNASVLEFTDNEAMIQLSEDMKLAGIRVVEYKTDMTGVISYNIDGYETLSRSDLTTEHFDRSEYERKRLKSGDRVAQGDPVFKLVTDEKWEIVFPMSEKDSAEYSGNDSLKINFKDRNISSKATFTMFRSSDGSSYGALDLKRYMVQFVSDRFVDFEIETNNVSGLKIPEKSITEKSFYLIPSSYRKKDAAGNIGFYKETLPENGIGYTFIIADVYNDDGENCYVRLPDSGELKEGDFAVDPEQQGKRYQIGPLGTLKGVYNINKGYAVFKRIEELERANGYCIIKKGSAYGLNVYDHIILDASTVEEGQILY